MSIYAHSITRTEDPCPIVHLVAVFTGCHPIIKTIRVIGHDLRQCSEPSGGPTEDGGDNAKRTGRAGRDGTASRSPV